MLHKEILSLLNKQIWSENMASYYYLKLSALFSKNGYSGISNFFLRQSNEEREHMLKLFKYITEQCSEPTIPSYNYIEEEMELEFDIIGAFEDSLFHEKEITISINRIISKCIEIGDYRTKNFLTWFVEEQMEEENKFNNLIEELKIISYNKNGLYMFNEKLK
jgi:ferritin